MRRQRRFLLIAIAAPVLVLGLGACQPRPGEGGIEFVGERNGRAHGPTVTCKAPFVDGEMSTPTWQWNGTVNGETVEIALAGAGPEKIVDSVWLTISGQSYAVLADPDAVQQLSVDEDGTLRARAEVQQVQGPGGPGSLIIKVALRCPVWPLPPGYSDPPPTTTTTVPG